MATTPALVTVEEFLKLPEPQSGHYELHHGEVVHVTAPKKGHQKLQEQIRNLLENIAEHHVIRVEMAFRPSPEYEVWQADVGVISKERDDATPDDEYIQGAPDLVIEVLSPGNTAEEIEEKKAVCIEHGCQSFWVVNGKRRTVDVTENDLTRHYKESATITNDVLGGSIRIEEIFSR